MAYLGEQVSTGKTGVQLKAAANNKVMMQNYSVVESAYDGGTQKEYVAADGTVFAVTWEGRAHTDPSQILGSYQQDLQSARRFHQAMKGQHFERGPVKLSSGDLVYETSGHMGKVHGRAYVPSLIPDSVSLKDIQ